jgi:hypothetical protein
VDGWQREPGNVPAARGAFKRAAARGSHRRAAFHPFGTFSRRTGGHVARNPWRARGRLIGAVLAGMAAGILVGILLVYLLLSPHVPGR